MGNYNNYIGSSGDNSGFNGKYDTGSTKTSGVTFPTLRYYNKYTSSTGIKGDATNADATNGWYSDNSTFIASTSPFFKRGGYYGNSTSSGIYYYNTTNGSNSSNSVVRIVLVKT